MGTKLRRIGLSGIGGFMESVLAMMVVICGVMLVTMSLSFIGIGLRNDTSGTALEDACRSLSGQFFSLGCPFFNGDVLQSVSLHLLNSTLFRCSSSVGGYCISIEDISAGAASAVLLRSGCITAENDSRSSTIPLLLLMPDQTVHAAKATVIVWR